jgi:hypothetical protein
MEDRIKQALKDPNLQDGVLQRLRDEFGADSQVASDNTIVLMFAGRQGMRLTHWFVADSWGILSSFFGWTLTGTK